MKKIIIGLPSPEFLSLEELEQLCLKHGDKIEYWYISPPFGKQYSSRDKVLYDFSITNIIALQEQLNIIKKYNQKIELALNARNLLNYNYKEVEYAFELFCKIYGQPNSIVTLKEFIPYFNNFNIPITYSFNNIDYDKNILPLCKKVVLGSKDIRNIKLMNFFKTEYNLDIELLVNNGCHFLCNKQCGQMCFELQQKSLALKDKYQCLAEQSLLPCELILLNDYIDNIKISSRPATYKDIDDMIVFYSNFYSFLDLERQIPLNQINSWRYFARLTNLLNLFFKENVDYEKVLILKNKIWENILNYSIDLKELNCDKI